ncbi:MAG: DNA polymerase III subunit tau [Chlamydiae bacterium]|nr:DNA polymerase III subunit tau [Chlamydiota bacterium]
MQKYQIIPRKFRPKRFSEVAGHKAVVETLKNALLSERIGQAYLFSGMRGCGKTTLARLLAKALNCESLSQDAEPCNGCTSCLEISEGRSLDMIEIDGASNRGIDDIRQLNETVFYAPNKGQYKIYIIDEVHMLTKEAFNALLKTLEEPPKSVKFFFATTEPHKIPATIISRCQRFHLGRIPEEDLIAKLIRIASNLEVEVEREALEQVCTLSEGSLRDAESLFDQLICFGKTPITLALTREVFGLISTEHLFELDEAIQSGNLESAAQLARDLYQSGKDLSSTLDAFLEHFRTYLLTHLGKAPQGPYQKWAGSYTKEHCLSLLNTLLEWQKQMGKMPFKLVHLEMLLFQLVTAKQRIPLEDLALRLIDLEQRLTSEPVTAEIKISPIQLEDPKKIIPPQEKKKEEVFSEPAPETTLEMPKVSTKEDSATEIKTEQKNEPSSPSIHPSHYDTLIRFAAVELEGTTKGSQ